jgi:MOSC domain-containing protein YiiM
MFGVPSGPLLDPFGIFETDAGACIEHGMLVAPLELQFAPGAPYPNDGRSDGAVEAVMIAPEATAPLTRVPEAHAVAGRGLEGDRYAEGRGTFAGRRGYDLTLIEAEAIEGLAEDAAVEISWEEARRNVVTRGIDLNSLVGVRFRIGEVECVGRRLAEPCAHLERLTRPGVLRGLVHRAGLRADILTGGVIRPGDTVVAQPPSG